MKCPKCGKEAEQIGILGLFKNEQILMISHGAYTYHGPFGSSVKFKERCFLNYEQSKQVYSDLVECNKCHLISREGKWRCSCHMTEEEIREEEMKWEKIMYEDYLNDCDCENYREQEDCDFEPLEDEAEDEFDDVDIYHDYFQDMEE